MRATPGTAAIARCSVGREERACRRAARAHVDVGGQHAHEPVVERLPERRDHDRHRHHERHAGDDGREAHAGLSRARRAVARARVRPAHARGGGRCRERERGDPRQQQQRADQQQRDRDVTDKRQAPDRRQQRSTRRRRASEHRAGRRRAQSAEHLLLVARLERGRGLRARRLARGDVAAERRHGDARSARTRSAAPGIEHEPRRDAAEVARAEVGADHAKHRRTRVRSPPASPTSDPATPTSAPSPTSSAASRRASCPSVRSNANCAAPAHDRQRLRREHEQCRP